jgi:hypothetical protein
MHCDGSDKRVHFNVGYVRLGINYKTLFKTEANFELRYIGEYVILGSPLCFIEKFKKCMGNSF